MFGTSQKPKPRTLTCGSLAGLVINDVENHPKLKDLS